MKRVNSALLGYVSKHWKGIVSAAILAAILIILFLLGINSIDGQNTLETKTLETLKNFPRPWYRALNAPYLVPAYLVGRLLDDMLLAARLVSIFYGLLATLCIFLLVRLWFNVRIAVVAMLLFATSSWLLIVCHQASPLCLMATWPLIVITPLAWFFRSKHHKFISFSLFSVALGISFYIPYMAWVNLVVLLVLLTKERKKLLLLKRFHIIVAGILFFITLLPLFYSLMNYPGQIRELLGIPIIWPTVSVYIADLGNLLSMIFLRSKPLPQLYLANLPMLDFFTSAMFILGLYYFMSRLPNRRSLIILISLAVLLLVLPLNLLYQLYAVILMPFIYIVVTVGFVELINQWVAYFPRNPLVKNIGILLIVLSIGLISLYHLEKYYIAWPNNPQVKQAYMIKSK